MADRSGPRRDGADGSAAWQRHYGGVGGRWSPTAAGRKGCMFGLFGLLGLALLAGVIGLLTR